MSNAAATVTAEYTCNKCNGTGRINGFSHYAKGVCFECSGNGTCISRPVNGNSYGDPVEIAKWADINARRSAYIGALDGADPMAVVATFRKLSAGRVNEIRNYSAGAYCGEDVRPGCRVAYWAASTVLGMWPSARPYPVSWIDEG